MQTEFEQEISPLIQKSKSQIDLWHKTKWVNTVAIVVAALLLGALGYFTFYSSGHNTHRLINKLQASSTEYTEAAIADLVTELPGLSDEITFNHFSGYVSLDENKKLFYWFLEASEVDPSDAPLVLWTNGGPGCSGLLGALSENGAFWVDDNLDIYVNPYSWNRIANMLFVEQPFGVGFSSDGNDNDVVAGDVASAQDLDTFLRQFLVKFPKYTNNKLYLSAESYGGHYLPNTALTILENNNNNAQPYLNFYGFLVGNPYTDYFENEMGFINSLYGHGLVQEEIYEEWRSKCWGDNAALDSDDCYAMYVGAYLDAGDIDFYAVDYPECIYDETLSTLQNNKKFKSSGYKQVMTKFYITQRLNKAIKKLSHNPNNLKHQTLLNKALKLKKSIVYSADETPYYSCAEYQILAYLNKEDVQSAIHSNVMEWSQCSDEVYDAWPSEDWYFEVELLYKKLVDDYDITILIYSGDDDTVCGTSGTLYWLTRMDWQTDEDHAWEEWQIDEETAGFYTRYLASDKTALHFTTVRSAGHMVPTTQPKRAYELFKKYLYEWSA